MRLWLVKQTDKARLYRKHNRGTWKLEDYIWIPLSVIEHTTQRGDEHEVTLSDWFIEKEGL